MARLLSVAATYSQEHLDVLFPSLEFGSVSQCPNIGLWTVPTMEHDVWHNQDTLKSSTPLLSRDAGRDAHVVGPELLLADRERAPKLGLGAVVVPLRLSNILRGHFHVEKRREWANKCTGRRDSFVFWREPGSVCSRLRWTCPESDCRGPPSTTRVANLEQDGEVVERGGDVRVVRSELLLADRERAPEQRLGVVVLALRLQQDLRPPTIRFYSENHREVQR